MVDLLSSFSTAISIVKRLNEVGKNIQNAEFKNLLADLSLELADVKLKLSSISIENIELKQEIAKLRQGKSIGDELEYRDGLYYTHNGDGPFCTACYDKESEKIRVTEQKGRGTVYGKFKCPICNEYYG